MRKLKLVIAGGGTGGHIFPAIAIAQAILRKRPDTEFLFIGARDRMEMEKVPQAGFAIEGLDIAGLDRNNWLNNISLPFKLIRSYFQVRRIINTFRPDAAIGVGGYSSFPVLRYAQQKGIPTFIHESNAFAGKANIMLGKRADAVFVASGGMETFFPADRIHITGNPVRSAIAGSLPDPVTARRSFGLDPDRATVLSVGGSLGARSINEAIEQGLDALSSHGLQLIWQTGKPFEERGLQAARGRDRVRAMAFIQQMEYAYAAADLVVSRAGAMAIAELCVTGKPALFVPYPFAAENHQEHNARELVKRQAARMIPDGEAAEQLIPAILELATDPRERETMGRNIRRGAVANADDRIADIILQHLDKKKSGA